MPLERANLPLEGVFGVGADDLIGLGYKWLKIGDKGAIYEKFLGHEFAENGEDLVANFKVIKIEKSDNDKGNCDYILMGCRQEGIKGKGGHRAVWLTFDEVKAAYHVMKKAKKRDKIRSIFGHVFGKRRHD